MFFKHEIEMNSFFVNLMDSTYGFNINIWTKNENFKIDVSAFFNADIYNEVFFCISFAKKIEDFLNIYREKRDVFSKATSNEIFIMLEPFFKNYYSDNAIKNIAFELKNNDLIRLQKDLKETKYKIKTIDNFDNLKLNVSEVFMDIKRLNENGDFVKLRSTKINYNDFNVLIKEFNPSEIILTNEMQSPIIKSAINQVLKHSTTRKRVCF